MSQGNNHGTPPRGSWREPLVIVTFLAAVILCFGGIVAAIIQRPSDAGAPATPQPTVPASQLPQTKEVQFTPEAVPTIPPTAYTVAPSIDSGATPVVQLSSTSIRTAMDLPSATPQPTTTPTNVPDTPTLEVTTILPPTEPIPTTETPPTEPPEATPIPAPTSVPFGLPFEDSFDSGFSDEWQLIEGERTIQDGRLLKVRGNATSILTMQVGDDTLKDYTVSFDYESVGRAGRVIAFAVALGPTFRYAHYDIATNQARCYWQELVGGRWESKVELEQCMGTQGPIQIKVAGDTFTVSRGNAQLSSNIFENVEPRGPVELSIRRNIFIDNFKITSP
jgi:hypothetical protein